MKQTEVSPNGVVMARVQKHVVPERRKEREVAPTQSLLVVALNVVVALPTHVRKQKPKIVTLIVAQVSNFSLRLLQKVLSLVEILPTLIILILYLVDGGYSEWGTWGTCSKTCEDNATRVRERNCTNPAPSCGGDDCVPVTNNGTTIDLDETEPCNQGVLCPGAYFCI